MKILLVVEVTIADFPDTAGLADIEDMVQNQLNHGDERCQYSFKTFVLPGQAKVVA